MNDHKKLSNSALTMAWEHCLIHGVCAWVQVYDHGRLWSAEEYQAVPKTARDIRQIRRDMHKQREWRAELDRMKVTLA